MNRLQAQCARQPSDAAQQFNRSCNSAHQGQRWDTRNNQNDRKRRDFSHSGTADITDLAVEHKVSCCCTSYLSDDLYSAECTECFLRCNKRVKCEIRAAVASTAVKKNPDAHGEHMVNTPETRIEANTHSSLHAFWTPDSLSVCSSSCTSDQANAQVINIHPQMDLQVTSSWTCAQSQLGLMSDVHANPALPSLLEYVCQTLDRARGTDCDVASNQTPELAKSGWF